MTETSENKAKGVEIRKQRAIDIPKAAKVNINQMTANLNNYIVGMVAGMNIKGKWTYDFNNMKIIVEEH